MQTQLETFPDMANILEMYKGNGSGQTLRAAADARLELAKTAQMLKLAESGRPLPVPDACGYCHQQIEMMKPSRPTAGKEVLVLPCLHAMHFECFFAMTLLHPKGFGVCPMRGCKYDVKGLVPYVATGVRNSEDPAQAARYYALKAIFEHRLRLG